MHKVLGMFAFEGFDITYNDTVVREFFDDLILQHFHLMLLVVWRLIIPDCIDNRIISCKLCIKISASFRFGRIRVKLEPRQHLTINV